jgi:hypothetical protein
MVNGNCSRGYRDISEVETIYQVSTTSHNAPAILRDDIPIEDLVFFSFRGRLFNEQKRCGDEMKLLPFGYFFDKVPRELPLMIRTVR